MRLRVSRRLRPAVVALALFAGTPLAGVPAAAQEIAAGPTNRTGVYAVGDKVEWRVELKGAKDVAELGYVIKKGGLTPVKDGKLPLTNGVATLETPAAEPGTILVEFKAKVGDKPVRGSAGAVVAPEKVGPSSQPPADFDAFWTAKLADLAAVPMNAKLEPGDAGKPNVEYAKLTLDNVRGTKVRGQLAKPKKEGKLPALLIVQWAGVYGLPKSNVVLRAEQGWLCLNIMAHDLPFDQPEAFYKEQSAGPLKDYTRIGLEDRDAWYFLRMYLGCHRATEYLASHPDWDGKTLVVMGTSQGGMQSILTAAIQPKVTAMIANVPGGCDFFGSDVGRTNGWPNPLGAAWDKDKKKVRDAVRYYDLAYWAPRIKCPALVSVGLIDETCTPPGVFATCNLMARRPEMVIMPLSDHQGRGGAQSAFFKRSEEWLRALAKGEPVPEPKATEKK
ncbi:MAG TPA: acetylxylan esterase [Humisphaera sp.]